MKNIALYAGTFDPVTNGHLDIIKRASQLCDTLYVTISSNPNKKTLFSIQERIDLLKLITHDIPNVVIDSSDELTVEHAKKIGAKLLVRGLRATMDFEYELQLASSNQYLDETIETIFLMSRPNHSFISSSTVKEIASHHHNVTGLVPNVVEVALKNKFEK